MITDTIGSQFTVSMSNILNHIVIYITKLSNIAAVWLSINYQISRLQAENAEKSTILADNADQSANLADTAASIIAHRRKVSAFIADTKESQEMSLTTQWSQFLPCLPSSCCFLGVVCCWLLYPAVRRSRLLILTAASLLRLSTNSP